MCHNNIFLLKLKGHAPTLCTENHQNVATLLQRLSRPSVWRWRQLQELSSSWDGRPFSYNRHGPKRWKAAVPLLGERGAELGPHLTQCRLGWDLLPY